MKSGESEKYQVLCTEQSSAKREEVGPATRYKTEVDACKNNATEFTEKLELVLH